MATQLTSRQNLADYCLRKLGAPVLNVEIDDSQMEDIIDDALLFYREYHFDGIERGYLVYKIKGTAITVANITGFFVGGSVWSLDGKSTGAIIKTIVGNTLYVNHQVGFTKFVNGQDVTNGNPLIQTTITNLVIGDVDNGWVPVDDSVVGVTKILNITSILGSSDYMFNMQYQIMMTELQALTKAGAAMYYHTLNYLAHLDFILKKEKNFSFNRRMNKLVLEIAWQTDVLADDILVAEVYRFTDEEQYPKVFDDLFVRKYATALMKKQLGVNLKKYTGLQLPGGITYNGQQIFDEAVAEIKELEFDSINNGAPLEFMIG